MNAQQYRKAQDAALAPLLTRIRQYFHLLGVPVTESQQQEMAANLWRVTRNARARIYNAAVAYLEGEGVVQDIPAPDGYPVQALTDVLTRVTRDTLVAGDTITLGNRKDTLVVETARKAVGRAASRHAQEPARVLVKDVADHREGVGWARMLTGATSCAFCAMLASRGPIFSSRKAALYRGGSAANTYHDGCDCIAVLVKDPHTWEGREAHERLEDLWINTGGKESNKAALNAFRREWDKQVRAGETHQYVALEPHKPAPKVEPAKRPADPLPNMLKKKAEVDRATDLALVNPRFDDSKQWKINCTRCTTTVELRARGYDVTAKPKPASVRDHSNRSVLNRWLSPDGKTPAGMNAGINGEVNRLGAIMGRRTPLGMHVEHSYGPSSKVRPETSSRVWDTLPKGAGQNGAAKLAADEAVASWGEGARGFITVQWRRGNSGHIFNVENRGGKAVYIDGQNNTLDAASHWDNISNDAGAAHIVRVDDLTPRDEPNAPSVTEWVTERTDKHLKAEVTRLRKQAEKKAAQIPKPQVTDLMQAAQEHGIDLGNKGYKRYKAFTDGAKDAETKPTVDAAAYSANSDLQDAYLSGFFWYRKWRVGR